jgi:phosphoserine phosphatase
MTGTRPLPSWRDGLARAAILDFVRRVTSPGPDFVAPMDRIAVFDNDGTLWAEQPVPVQAAFVLDRIRALAPQFPEWREQQPFKAVLEGNVEGVMAMGMEALVKMVMATHAGITTDEFSSLVQDWITTARHPRFDRLHTDLVYQPMLELLAMLRSNGFKNFIVSGGGIEFMRSFSESLYDIPPEQVIGSSIVTRYVVGDAGPELRREAELHFYDDKAGKPVAINKFIGRRPILAVGNSDGDFEMLEWTTGAPGARLGVIVHHDDAAREYAYDRKSPFGKLARGLDEAATRGWVVVSMKDDWRAIHAPR